MMMMITNFAPVLDGRCALTGWQSQGMSGERSSTLSVYRWCRH